jgi:signal transduction histidine kinase
MLVAAATLVPLVALGWLGARTLQQERQLDGQRLRERLHVAAARVALDIERRLLRIEDQLAAGHGVQFSPVGIESSPEIRVLFQPVDTLEPAPQSLPDSLFARAEAREFQRRDLPGAETEYQRVASTTRLDVRAAALVGLARVRRSQRNFSGALDAYGALEQLGTVLVAGQPAALVAYQGRCKTLEIAGDVDRLTVEVRRLGEALESGSFPIDRATFDLYRDLLDRWKGTPPSSESIVRTEALIELWQLWRRGDLVARGRRALMRGSVPLLAVWMGHADRLNVWIASGSELEHEWRPIWTREKLDVAVSDIEGRAFAGVPGPHIVSLTPNETRLPFILSASLRNADPGDSARRRPLMVGLVLAFAMTVAAAFALYRTTGREIALARQQADFVAAVSHEFRTPLTSMRHLTELLESQAISSEERKTQYYALLARETERLHRMVESLLTFGRMDVKAYTFHLEPAEVEHIVTNIVDEFRRECTTSSRRVDCEIEKRLPAIRADREALSRALWNLLENAAKYSDSCAPIYVFARRHGDSVLVGVRDEGSGIPRAEQRRIFQKFVRGADAKRSGVRGVGLGLALVTRIVEAHGGSVRLESEPGRGSTFTLVLPCLGS